MEKTIETVIKQLGKYGIDVTREEARQIIIHTLGSSYALEAFRGILRKDILMMLIGGATVSGIYIAVKLTKKKN